MKLVNRKEFLSLPSGILYSNYESLGNLNGLALKTGTFEDDWVYENLVTDIDVGESDFADYMLPVEEENKQFKMDLKCGRRDGCFEKDKIFAVYETEDVDSLLDKLIEIKNNYPIK